ncbi:MAG TPA: MerR family DNA-binding transcriptional regulator [Pseudonocardia sp.]|jgi:DNA-binding transcriptional MerR regulator|nr:MerR family DNA-binding transcriptional regulator [Pseudonocardia sp.]
MVEHESKRLVTTGEAARALGVSARTLQRYAHDGLVTPDVILPSPRRPQYRWDILHLREQIRSLNAER